MASPSGDLYATREQVARLEEIVTQQQIIIKNLEQQKDLFSLNINQYIQEQMEEMLKNGGSRSLDYMNMTKFITKHMSAAVSQIQSANVKMLEESIPVKTLQMLERRLLAKPCATDDLASLSSRINSVEITVQEIPVKQIQQIQHLGEPKNSVSSIEIDNLRQHIQHIENNLITEIQRSNSSMTKVGELSGPFIKLQQQVNFLQQDVKGLKAADGQAIAEKLITNTAAVLRHEFQDYMETRASTEEVKKLQSDISRIEEFSREVQTGFYSMRNKSQQLMDEMTTAFSVEKWNRLSNNLKKEITANVEMSRKLFMEEMQVKASEFEQIANTANSTVKRLDFDIRSQYGPEMLNIHLGELQRELKKQQTEFQQGLEKKLETKLEIMDKQLNSYRQTIREFTAEIRTEISESGLLEKYTQFQDKLLKQEKTFEQWGAKLNYMNDWHRKFKEEIEETKLELLNIIKGFEGELNTVRHSINKTKQEVKKELHSWLNDRQIEIQGRFGAATDEVIALRDTFMKLREEIMTEIVEQKQKEKYLEFQKLLENKVQLWQKEKDNYLISKMIDVNHQVEFLAKRVEEREQHFNEVFSEDTVQEFVREMEKRIKLSQEDWNGRRLEEFNSRYLKIEKLLNSAYDYMNDGRKLQKDLENTYSEHTLNKYVKEIETRLKSFQGDWMIRRTEFFQGEFIEIRNQVNKFSAVAQAAEERESKLAATYNENNLRKFINDIETRLKATQNSWVTRRNEELNRRYDEFKQQIVKVLKIALEIQEKGKKIEEMHGEEKLKLFAKEFMKEIEMSMKTENESWNKEQTKKYTERYLELQNELSVIKDREKKFTDWQKSHEIVCKQVISVSENLRNFGKSVTDKLNAEVEKFKELRENIGKEFQEELLKFITQEKMVELQNTIFNTIQKQLKNIHINHARTEIKTIISGFNSLKDVVDTIESRLDTKLLGELDEKYKPILQAQLDELNDKLLQRNERWLKQHTESLNAKQSSMVFAMEKELLAKFALEEEKSNKLREEARKRYEEEIAEIEENKKWLKQYTDSLNIKQKNMISAIEKDILAKFSIEESRFRELREETRKRYEEEIDEIEENKKWIKEQISNLKIKQTNWNLEIEKQIKRLFTEEETKSRTLRKDMEIHFADEVEYFETNKKWLIEQTEVVKKEQEKWMRGFEVMIKNKVNEDYKNSLIRDELSRQFQEELRKFTRDDKMEVLRDVVLAAIKKNLRDIHTEYAKYELYNVITELNSHGERLEAIEMRNYKLSSNPWSTVNLEDDRYSGMNKCFYTAIFGLPGEEVDTLPVIENKMPGWDYICFTNQTDLVGVGWNIVRVGMIGKNPGLEAMRYKWLSHRYLLDYDVAIWVDGYIAPRSIYSELLKQWIMKMMNENITILHRPHEERDCVYDECQAILDNKKDTVKNIEKVKKLLYESRVPKHSGLFDTNILVKFHKNSELQEISEKIYKYLETSSNRDQVIVPLVYRKYKFAGYLQDNLIRAFETSGKHIIRKV